MLHKDKRELKDNQLSLKELIDVKEWQKIQDKFASIADIGLRLVDSKGSSITLPSKESRLCSELLKEGYRTKEDVCNLCLPTFLGGRAVVDKNLGFVCSAAGLHGFLAPLKLENRILGYVIVGPAVLVMRKPKEQYRDAAQKLGIDLEDFWSAILEIKVISFHGAQSLLELIKDLAENSLKLAYQIKIKEKEPVISLGLSDLTKFFDALLDVAFEISKAEIGSVMFLDKAKNELRIKASRGIADDIVRNTRVKMGMGISGIAAKEGRSFLIDENTENNRIRPYLNRPKISSSMVIPLKVRNRVVGVMNIGALNTSNIRFNKNNMSLMTRLADLVALAIQT